MPRTAAQKRIAHREHLAKLDRLPFDDALKAQVHDAFEQFLCATGVGRTFQNTDFMEWADKLGLLPPPEQFDARRMGNVLNTYKARKHRCITPVGSQSSGGLDLDKHRHNSSDRKVWLIIRLPGTGERACDHTNDGTVEQAA